MDDEVAEAVKKYLKAVENKKQYEARLAMAIFPRKVKEGKDAPLRFDLEGKGKIEADGLSQGYYAVIAYGSYKNLGFTWFFAVKKEFGEKLDINLTNNESCLVTSK